MDKAKAKNQAAKTQADGRYDAIIIGGGISGMYQLLRLREMGLSVKVYEVGGDVGGTWYWNRYPGARFDSESYSYGYSFSDELLQEWDWKEHFAGQPETLEYLNYFADKFDIRKDIQFNTRVTAATYDETAKCWEVETENGDHIRAPILITALGPLTVPLMPKIDGIDSFEGIWFHTGNAPHADKGYGGKYTDFTGMRVGVVGTGASGVQTIAEVAKTADELFVFQQMPEYCAPLLNSEIDEETQKKIKASYPEIFKKCKESFGSFIHNFDPRSALDVDPEEREAFFEELYGEPGFGIWLGTYHDTLVNQEANDLLTEFIRKKIRERINDPELAEKLIPTDHGFGLRRVPMDTNYYEAYNQDNVHLVDVGETPIERITPKGVKVGDTEYELDLIIYATGFDAVTGGFNKIDIRGKGGQKLKDKWGNGPQTYLGMQTVGFPNMFTLVGPHNGATFCNMTRCIEETVEWLTELIRHMRDNGIKTVGTVRQT
jgi:cation diffusion facilitator CzcD-associated flavoprotein CzcO